LYLLSIIKDIFQVPGKQVNTLKSSNYYVLFYYYRICAPSVLFSAEVLWSTFFTSGSFCLITNFNTFLKFYQIDPPFRDMNMCWLDGLNKTIFWLLLILFHFFFSLFQFEFLLKLTIPTEQTWVIEPITIDLILNENSRYNHHDTLLFLLTDSISDSLLNCPQNDPSFYLFCLYFCLDSTSVSS